MASSLLIAKRYSKALHGLAASQDQARQWLEPLAKISENFQSSAEFEHLLVSPGFDIEEKWKVLSALLKQYEAPKELEKFLRHVAEAKRLAVLPEIVSTYKDLVLENENTVEATLETAIDLGTQQIDEVKELLSATLAKKVNLKVQVNPSLLAGLRIHVNGKTLDATLMSSLESMQQTLLSASAVEAKARAEA